MRMVDADKLFDWVEYYDRSLDKNNPFDVVIKGALDTIMMHIDNMDELRWIPVEEELPEAETWVLVACDFAGNGKTVTVKGMYWHSRAAREMRFREWGTYCDITDSVKAWMPLPEPWEGEE